MGGTAWAAERARYRRGKSARRGGTLDREADREAAAPARLALDGQRAAVGVDDRPGDREPEAGTARLPGPRRVEPDERLEDPLGVGRRDADAGILDGDLCLPADHPQRQLNLASCGRVLEGVLDEI